MAPSVLTTSPSLSGSTPGASGASTRGNFRAGTSEKRHTRQGKTSTRNSHQEHTSSRNNTFVCLLEFKGALLKSIEKTNAMNSISVPPGLERRTGRSDCTQGAGRDGALTHPSRVEVSAPSGGERLYLQVGGLERRPVRE